MVNTLDLAQVIQLVKAAEGSTWLSGMTWAEFTSAAEKMGYIQLATKAQGLKGTVWAMNGGVYKTAAELGTSATIDNSSFAASVATAAQTAALEGGSAESTALVVADATVDATAETITSVTPVAAAGTIAGTIAAGAAAVAGGALLGAAVYASNPTFFNNLEGNVTDLTPWKWDDIPMCMRQTGGTTAAPVNTSYLPADFVQAILGSMYTQGAYSGVNKYNYGDYVTYGAGQYFWQLDQTPTFTENMTIVSGVQALLCFQYTGTGDAYRRYIQFLSKSPFYLTIENTSSANNFITNKNSGQSAASKYTYNGNIFYAKGTSTDGFNISNIPYAHYSGESYDIYSNTKLLYDITYNSIDTSTEGISGIKTESGATYPTSGSPDLSTLYPTWWNNKLTVHNFDGTSTDFLPVQLPTADPTTAGNTGTQSSSQTGTTQDTQYPTDDDIIKKIKDWIISITPSFPVDPTPTPTPTPTPVTPIGSTKAMWSIYNPSLTQVQALGGWLWSSSFVDQLIKMFNNPAEAIISLHKVFVTPTISGTGHIVVGYLDSQVSSNIVSKQYETFDCGTVSLQEYFGNCEDYSNFTAVQLYLPFVGFVKLNTNDVMATTINVTYKVDNYTGAFLAIVTVTKNGAALAMYQYGGNMGVHYPLSSGSFASVITSLISTGAGIAGTIATGGALAPVALGGAMSLLNSRATVSVSGGFNACTGAMGIKKPYLIIIRPKTYNAAGYTSFYGLPNNITVSLGALSGFTRVKNVFTTVSKATDAEKSEIETILKEGVIL